MTTHPQSPAQAALAIVAGMFVLGFTDNLVAVITPVSSLAQFHLVRSALVIAALCTVARIWRLALWPRKPWAVLGRSSLTAGAMVIYFGCIAILPIGVVVAGLFTAPLFVVLISVLLQGQKVGAVRSIAVVLGFVGALMVIRPDPTDMNWATVLPVLAGLFYAGGAVATRAWCEGESTLCLSMGFFALLMIAGAVGCSVLPGPSAEGFIWRGWMPLSPPVLGWYGVMAAGALIGIFLIFRGYQLGDASFVAVFEYSMLIFASGWAFLMWDERLPPVAIAGMGLIAVAGVVIALRGRAV